MRPVWAVAACLVCATAALAQKPAATPPMSPTAVKQQKSAVPAANYPEEAAVIERIRVRIHYNNNGTSDKVQYVRVRIQAQPAIQAWGQLVFNYNHATDKVHVDFVRVHKPDGHVVIAGPEAVQDLSSPVKRVAPVYTSLRQIHITVPDLSIGDTLAYQITTQTIHPLVPGQFFFEWNFSRKVITLKETLTANLPRGRKISLRTANGIAAPAMKDEGDRRIYTWHSSFTHRPKDSGGQNAKKKAKPPKYPDVALSTFDSWAQVGQWYATLARPRAAVTPAIRAQAATLVKGQTTAIGKVKAIYDYVAENIRYVSLSFGLGQYQPHPAAEVLANQYGDCKDKATLFEALLAAEGIHSYPVLINAVAKVDPNVPSPGQFDHLINIVQVDGKSYWADTTPGVAPLGFLLPTLRDKRALAIPAAGDASLVRTPQNPPFMPVQDVNVKGRVDSSGDLQGTLSLSATGGGAVILRLALRMVPKSYWSRLANVLVSLSIGKKAKVDSFHFSDPEKLDQPMSLDAKFTDPNFVDMTRKSVALSLPAKALDLPSVDKPAAGSTSALRLGVIHNDTLRWQIEMPPSLTVELPLAVNVSRDYAEYQSSYANTGRTVTAVRHLVIRKAKIPPARYDDFQAFRATVTADEGQQLSLTNPAPGSASIQAGTPASDLYQRGLDAERANNYKEAARFYAAAGAKDSDFPNVWNALGHAYNEIGEFTKASAALKKAIQKNPYDPYAYNNLGLADVALGNKDTAEREFLKQIEINPLDQYAHANLASLYLVEKKYAPAQKEFQTALKITPKHYRLNLGLGDSDLGLHQDQAALAAFRKALAGEPQAIVWGKVAYILAAHHTHLKLAAQYAEDAIRIAEVQLSAVSLDTLGPRQTMMPLAIATEWDTMGWIRFQQGDLKAAQRYVRAAWILSDQARIGDLLGRIYEKEGKRAEAVRTFGLALLCAHPSDKIRDRLGALIGKKRAERRPWTVTGRGLAGRRTVNLLNPRHLTASAVFWLLLAPGTKPVRSGAFAASVVGVKFVSGDRALQTETRLVRAARLPYSFPTGAPAQLLLRALLSCSKFTHSCTLVPFPAEETASETTQADAMIFHY